MPYRTPLVLVFLLALLTIWNAPAVAQPDHHIAIRKVEGFAEFYDTRSDQTFVPRGTNYVELRRDQPTNFLTSGLFLPEFHDATDVNVDFERMLSLGYNTARIFIDLCVEERCIGDPAGGLRDDVMDNVASLLESARRYDIFILFTANWLPDFGGYLDAHESCRPDFDHGNCLLLHEAGVAAYKRFFQDFVRGLLDRNAATEMILGYQLRNEGFLELNAPPLNRASGTVTAANGETYDMASDAEKDQMVDEGLIFWANEVRLAIRELDPTALVTTGFFPPNDPHEWRPGDWRYVRTRAILRESELDFLDFHGYPGEGLTMDQHVENYGMDGYEEKPVIFGEFGAFLHHYDQAEIAAQDVQRWQAAACQAGFDGFLYWLWDPDKAPRVGDSVWGVYDGTGEIARAIAPVFQADPCTDGIVPNLALNRPATASRSLPDRPPERAVDGNVGTAWESGAHPPQWIEIDLGSSRTIGRMTLRVAQFPEGDTVHRISGRASPSGPDVLLHEIQQFTTGDEWLEVEPDEPWSGYRWLRVSTTISPSWVSWFEIEVYPPDSSKALPLPPDLQEPIPFETNLSTTPQLQWAPVALGDSFHVQVADTGGLGKIVFERSDLTGLSIVPDALPDNATYIWRVRAIGDDGAGPWSTARMFTVGMVGVSSSTDDLPKDQRLAAVYPNPSTTTVTFEVNLKRASEPELEIFDVRGRSVASVRAGLLSAGEHRLTWHPHDLPSGMYVYRLAIEGEQETGKVLFVR